MARVNNPLFEGVRGKVGNVVFKVRNGKTYIAALPETNKNRKRTPAQENALQNFRIRSAYAKDAMCNPSVKALYEAGCEPGQTAYNRAMIDASKPPEVLAISAPRNRKGVRDIVLVDAIDDFKVKEVKIAIVSAIGKLIEEGNAVQQHESCLWTYSTVNRNEIISGAKITATAIDYPGNKSELAITLE